MSGSLDLGGRMAVEFINTIKGCCVSSMLKWKPRMLGMKHSCMYCENTMKTVGASNQPEPEWSGMVNEVNREREEKALDVTDVWFSSEFFKSVEDVNHWCSQRGLPKATPAKDASGMAYTIHLAESVADTQRTLWADKGVVAVMGIHKMDTGSLASGGTLHPWQSADAEKPVEEDTEEKCDLSSSEEESEGSAQKSFEKALDGIFS